MECTFCLHAPPARTLQTATSLLPSRLDRVFLHHVICNSATTKHVGTDPDNFGSRKRLSDHLMQHWFVEIHGTCMVARGGLILN